MITPQKALAIVIALIVYGVLMASSGWLVHGWKYGNDRRKEEQRQHDEYVKQTERFNKAGESLDALLSSLEKNRYVTIKEVHHETTKTEYRCVLPDAGRVLFNRSAEPAANPG